MEITTKDKIKKGAKVTAAFSPAITALLVAPSETLMALKNLKEAGFELPAITIFISCVWWLRKDVMTIMNGRLGDINATINKFGDQLNIRNQISDKRYDEVNERFLKNDEKFNELGEKMFAVETRLQAVAPLPSREEIEILQAKIKQEIEQQKEPK